MHFSSAMLMKLCICFGICLSSKWLYLRLNFFFCFSFLKPWADNGSTNQYSCQLLYGWGWHTPCHSISEMHTVGETGETPSALSCFSFLIRSLLTNITWKLLSHVQLLVTPWTVVHGILQARILEWIAFPFSRVSSQPRDQTQVSHIAGGFLYQLSHKGSNKHRMPCEKLAKGILLPASDVYVISFLCLFYT